MLRLRERQRERDWETERGGGERESVCKHAVVVAQFKKVTKFGGYLWSHVGENALSKLYCRSLY